MKSQLFWRVATVAALAGLGLAPQAMAQETDVVIEKHTEGVDADTIPGPVLTIGNSVAWTYEIYASGGRTLYDVVVTDDQGVVVTCPSTTVAGGLSMVCTGSGTVVVGQYSNIGTVTANLISGDAGSQVSDTDPSHYYGQAAPSIAIETSTNGVDADTPTGPVVPVSSTVNWEYLVTNIGASALTNVSVSDDQGVSVVCPATDLAIGASMTCTASGVAQIGQYANVGIASGELPDTSVSVATDPSHYYGQIISLETATNGVDADLPIGPVLQLGDTVNWTYTVVNPGPATVTNLVVSDDQGVVVTCPVTTLAAGASTVCTATGVAVVGQYANVGTATADLPSMEVLTATDASHYYGNPLTIVKLTNNQDVVAAPGPSLRYGSAVTWQYEVTNNGSEDLSSVSVTDDQGVTVSCPQTTLTIGESMTCTASGSAVVGQYTNVGTASAQNASLDYYISSDSSWYMGIPYDFGDAPDSYGTLIASDGARHQLQGGLYLGSCVDAEADGLPAATADGDDLNTGVGLLGSCASAGDDEDGVTFPSPVVAGANATVTVVASGSCTLSAWIDFNGDGDWADSGEALFPSGTALSAGSNNLTFAVPSTTVGGDLLSRFRCTTDGPVSYTGSASDGEVEDHLVSVVPQIAVTASKSVALTTDVNSDGWVNPGDTLTYTIVIDNVSAYPGYALVFTDTPDANTTLVVGSVTTTAGSVTSGNGAGETTIGVDLGTLANGGQVTITFQVTVGSGFTVANSTVSNQGSVSGTNLPATLTDDPTQAGSSDPTLATVLVPTTVSASKRASLVVDLDHDLNPDPGDTLGYSITITNTGSVATQALQFTDTPDANTTLVSGSVTTTVGSVTTGNGGGDTSVVVDIGSLAAGASATIAFRALINDPLATDVTEVSNQGEVSGDNVAATLTDDPTVTGTADPTVTLLYVPIPTLGEWAALLLGLLLLGGALRRLRA